MPQNPQHRGRLRPVDLARRHGLSTQAVRNYEALGILPAAVRTPAGYRTYTPRHALALDAFAALVPGHGSRTAGAILRAVNRDATDEALRLVDESHAQLLDDRRTLRSVETALSDLASVPVPVPAPAPGPGPGPDDRGGTSVGPLAHRLGLRPATLRTWERAGVLRPRRDPRTGHRVYGPADVRDALLAHQLRRGGYPLARIAPLLDQVRAAGGVAPLAGALHDWHTCLTTRARALLTGAAALHTYLSLLAQAESTCAPELDERGGARRDSS